MCILLVFLPLLDAFRLKKLGIDINLFTEANETDSSERIPSRAQPSRIPFENQRMKLSVDTTKPQDEPPAPPPPPMDVNKFLDEIRPNLFPKLDLDPTFDTIHEPQMPNEYPQYYPFSPQNQYSYPQQSQPSYQQPQYQQQHPSQRSTYQPPSPSPPPPLTPSQFPASTRRRFLDAITAENQPSSSQGSPQFGSYFYGNSPRSKQYISTIDSINPVLSLNGDRMSGLVGNEQPEIDTLQPVSDQKSEKRIPDVQAIKGPKQKRGFFEKEGVSQSDSVGRTGENRIEERERKRAEIGSSEIRPPLPESILLPLRANSLSPTFFLDEEDELCPNNKKTEPQTTETEPQTTEIDPQQSSTDSADPSSTSPSISTPPSLSQPSPSVQITSRLHPRPMQNKPTFTKTSKSSYSSGGTEARSATMTSQFQKSDADEKELEGLKNSSRVQFDEMLGGVEVEKMELDGKGLLLEKMDEDYFGKTEMDFSSFPSFAPPSPPTTSPTTSPPSFSIPTPTPPPSILSNPFFSSSDLESIQPIMLTPLMASDPYYSPSSRLEKDRKRDRDEKDRRDKPKGRETKKCSFDVDCMSGEMCYKADGVCWNHTIEGVCAPIVEFCTDDEHAHVARPLDGSAPSVPVLCGCDGADYISVCQAHKNRVNIDFNGRCADKPPPSSPAEVEEQDFRRFQSKRSSFDNPRQLHARYDTKPTKADSFSPRLPSSSSYSPSRSGTGGSYGGKNSPSANDGYLKHTSTGSPTQAKGYSYNSPSSVRSSRSGSSEPVTFRDGPASSMYRQPAGGRR
ncbi:hypothetical protein BLNAU_20915 [Blattamonas nauphoetae]|uniref:Kazal-like domain-containing protein n=1 Tax=Blattamonas nauphoetae TaxID=2049346 RepID=A0ABQ9WXD7_9EUKA|nr:hypothetical protein BLNAU_20915 [Blattamonas nauphoetae]